MSHPHLQSLEPRTLLASLHFAVIGDYGLDGSAVRDVASRVKSWNPQLIVTTGDNNYPLGESSTIDRNIGKHYHDFIAPYTGSHGAGSPGGINRFFPTLGNHDWETAGAQPYLNYFSLPGNERYYTFTAGPIQFFMLDSDPHEPDLNYVNDNTNTQSSRQAQWLRIQMSNSTAPWQIVVMHHAPYSSSSTHGNARWMQWPFGQWGADAVLTGHDHNYERIIRDGVPYFVNGLGGAERRNSFATPVPGSSVRYAANHGAMLVDADDDSITFQFITRSGSVIDSYTHSESTIPRPGAPSALSAAAISASAIRVNWQDNSPDEAGFQIERSRDNTDWLVIATVQAGAITFTDSNLLPGRTYYYRVRSMTIAGRSSPSNVASAVTHGGPPTVAAPTNLAAIPASSTSIRLTWADRANNEKGFQLERSENGINFTRLPNWINENVTSFTDHSLMIGKKYYYRLRALNSTHTSPFSNIASATPSGAPDPDPDPKDLRIPGNFTATAISSTQIQLRWLDNSTIENGFQLERSANGATWSRIAWINRDRTSYTDKDLAPKRRYHYRIRAINSTQVTPFSNTAAATTK